MYGTLKGFAKFLFDSPTKDNSMAVQAQFHQLDINKEKISMVALSKKAFVAYSADSQNLYYINDSLKPELIF